MKNVYDNVAHSNVLRSYTHRAYILETHRKTLVAKHNKIVQSFWWFLPWNKKRAEWIGIEIDLCINEITLVDNILEVIKPIYDPDNLFPMWGPNCDKNI